MQFQDLTAQLIERTLRRVSGLRDFLGTLNVMARRDRASLLAAMKSSATAGSGQRRAGNPVAVRSTLRRSVG
jgi:hypothetical protein